MPTTVQEIINKARVPLNDDSKLRWPDAELLNYYNDALKVLRVRRPDLFFGTYSTPVDDQSVGDAVPIEGQYHPALCDYVTARAMFKDSEEAAQGAATSFYTLFGMNS